MTDFAEVKSVFGFRVRLGNPDLDFENLNPDFPIERTFRLYYVTFSLQLSLGIRFFRAIIISKGDSFCLKYCNGMNYRYNKVYQTDQRL